MRIILLITATVALVATALFFEKTYISQGIHECAQNGIPTLASCWKEVLVRSLLHLVGSVVIIFLMHVSKSFLRFNALLFLGIVIVLFFGIQEFYLHPLNYDQPLFKGIIDFFVWTTPVVVYLYFTRKAKVRT